MLSSQTSFMTKLLFPAMVVIAPAMLAAQTQYQTYDEAFRAGVKHYNAKNYVAAQEPFEAALKLTTDTEKLQKTYSALLPSYRQLPEIEKMLTATEFIITNSERDAERSLTRTDLLSFLHQRGKIDVAVKRYEDKLKAEPQHRTALFVLSEIYVRLKENPQRAAELNEQLAALDKQAGKKVDVRQQAELAQQYVKAKKFKEGAELFEKTAPLDERTAAWNWKEAATAWLKAGEKAKALSAAKQAASVKPEARSQILTKYWHTHLGDVYVDVGEPAFAVPHYEQAVSLSTIDSEKKMLEGKLAEARKKAEQKK